MGGLYMLMILLLGADTISNAFQLYKTADSVISEGGFNLCKWNSNSPSLLKSEQSNQKPWLEADRVKELEPEPDKLLGIQWFHHVESEVVQFRFTCLVFGLRPSPAIVGAVISVVL